MSLTPSYSKRSDEAELLGIEPDDTVTNQENIPLPWFVGPGRLSAKWISEPYNRDAVEPEGGGSKKTGGSSAASKINFGDVVGLYGGGPVDALRYIVYDNKIIWEGLVERNGSNPYYAQVDAGDWGTFRVYWGTQTSVDSLVISGVSDDHPPYLGIPYIVGKRVRFGIGKDAPGNLVLGVERSAWGSPSGLDYAHDWEGVGAFAACAEILLEDMQGLGMDTGVLDDTQWGPIATLAKKAEAYPIDGDAGHVASFGHIAPSITSQQPARRVINELLSYVDGFLRVNGTILEAGLEEHDGTVGGSNPELTHHSFARTPIVSKVNVRDVGELFVTYRDRTRHGKIATHYDDSLADTDLEPGMVQTATEKREAFPTEHQIQRWASEYLNTANEQRIQISGQIFLDELQGRVEGDEIDCNYLPASVDTTFRIVRLEDTDDPEVKIVKLLQKSGVYQLAYVPPEVLRPTIDLSPPDEVTNFRILQASKEYAEGVPAIWILGEKPTANAIGMHIHYSEDGASYDQIGDQNSFALKGTLDGDILSTASSFDIDASGLDIAKLAEQSDAAQNNDTVLVVVGDEIKSLGAVTANGGGSYTIHALPGRLGTVAAEHTNGDAVWIIERARLTLLEHKDFPYDTGDPRYFKLQPYSYSGGPRALGDVTAYEYEFEDIFVSDPTDFEVYGISSGYAIRFNIDDRDVVGCKVWVSDNASTFAVEPTFVQAIRIENNERYNVSFTHTKSEYQTIPKERFFKIQIFDDTKPNPNYSAVSPIVSSESGAGYYEGTVTVQLRTDAQFGFRNAGHPFTLRAIASEYRGAITYQWYRYPKNDPSFSTQEIIAGEDGPTLTVEHDDILALGGTVNYRRYGVRVNGGQYDEMTLHSTAVQASGRVYRLKNEVSSVEVDKSGVPLPAELGPRGPTACDVTVIEDRWSLYPSAAPSGAGQYHIVPPAGWALRTPRELYLDDPAALTGDETEFDLPIYVNNALVATRKLKVVKIYRSSLSPTLEIEDDQGGQLYYPQPIASPVEVKLTATVRRGEHDVLAQREATYQVDTDGVVTPIDAGGYTENLDSAITGGTSRLQIKVTNDGTENQATLNSYALLGGRHLFKTANDLDTYVIHYSNFEYDQVAWFLSADGSSSGNPYIDISRSDCGFIDYDGGRAAELGGSGGIVLPTYGYHFLSADSLCCFLDISITTLPVSGRKALFAWRDDFWQVLIDFDTSEIILRNNFADEEAAISWTPDTARHALILYIDRNLDDFVVYMDGTLIDRADISAFTYTYYAWGGSGQEMSIACVRDGGANPYLMSLECVIAEFYVGILDLDTAAVERLSSLQGYTPVTLVPAFTASGDKVMDNPQVGGANCKGYINFDDDQAMEQSTSQLIASSSVTYANDSARNKRCAVFDGSTSYCGGEIDLTGLFFQSLEGVVDDQIVAIRFKLDLDATGINSILTWTSASGSQTQRIWIDADADEIVFRRHVSGTSYQYFTIDWVNDGEWHDLVFMAREKRAISGSTTLYSYLDGEPFWNRPSQSFSAAQDVGTRRVDIGRYSLNGASDGEYYKGSISYIYFSNVAITPAIPYYFVPSEIGHVRNLPGSGFESITPDYQLTYANDASRVISVQDNTEFAVAKSLTLKDATDGSGIILENDQLDDSSIQIRAKHQPTGTSDSTLISAEPV